jgi:mannose-6-phosphate isomerase
MTTVTPARIKAWLVERHLPLWRGAGMDRRHGGFHERLDSQGCPLDLGYKRIIVQCRQLFVHAHAAGLGLTGADLDPVRHGLAFLTGHCRGAADGAWAFKVTPEGKVLDSTIDTYTHAFVLFALAHAGRALGDAAVLAEADRTLALMDRHLRLESGGYHAVAEPGWRRRPDLNRQNPNMHLIEAFVALYEASAAAAHRDHAFAIADLLVRHLVDTATGTLGEYFDASWRPDPATGHRVEPGHQFEWCWLLHRFARVFDRPDVLATADALFGFADRHGLDRARGGVYDEIDRSGRVLLGTKRLWPLTEYIKALAARLEAGSARADRAALDQALGWLFDHHLLPDGRWREHLAADLSVLNDQMPGSSSYHIALALTEAAHALDPAWVK